MEYRNTIRDLMGVDYDTNTEFPPDDTGHGFDNIGDVLTLPPMLLEKYLEAAQSIVGRTVPQAPEWSRSSLFPQKRFQTNEVAENGGRNRGGSTMSLSFYTPAAVSNTFKASQAGKYQLGVDLMVNERYVDNVFDYNKCRVTFTVDGKEMLQREFSWEGGRAYHYELETDWTADNHELKFELQPLTPNEEQTRTLSVQITSVTVQRASVRKPGSSLGTTTAIFQRMCRRMSRGVGLTQVDCWEICEQGISPSS